MTFWLAVAAFVLAAGWWAGLIVLVVQLRSAVRDPELTVKIMRKIGTLARPTTTTGGVSGRG